MQKPEKPPQDPELHRRVQELIAYKGGGYNEDLVADIVENGLKLTAVQEDPTASIALVDVDALAVHGAHRVLTLRANHTVNISQIASIAPPHGPNPHAFLRCYGPATHGPGDAGCPAS